MTLFSFVAIGVIITANSINKQFYNLPAIAFSKISPEVFTEFSVEWYRRISFQVTLTITFQIFTPHISNGGFHLINFTKRFYDQHFTCDRTKTRKMTQQDYVAVQMGSELSMEYRFSNLITLVFVVFFYGNGLPLLYPIAFFVLLTAYWVDKFFILRNLYQKPHQFEGGVVIAVNDYLKYSTVLFFLGGALCFSNSAIMSANTNLAETEGFTWGEFYNQQHMLIFYYGNAAIAVIGLFILFAVPPIAKCTKSNWLNET